MLVIVKLLTTQVILQMSGNNLDQVGYDLPHCKAIWENLTHCNSHAGLAEAKQQGQRSCNQRRQQWGVCEWGRRTTCRQYDRLLAADAIRRAKQVYKATSIDLYWFTRLSFSQDLLKQISVKIGKDMN